MHVPGVVTWNKEPGNLCLSHCLLLLSNYITTSGNLFFWPLQILCGKQLGVCVCVFIICKLNAGNWMELSSEQ